MYPKWAQCLTVSSALCALTRWKLIRVAILEFSVVVMHLFRAHPRNRFQTRCRQSCFEDMKRADYAMSASLCHTRNCPQGSQSPATPASPSKTTQLSDSQLADSWLDIAVNCQCPQLPRGQQFIKCNLERRSTPIVNIRFIKCIGALAMPSALHLTNPHVCQPASLLPVIWSCAHPKRLQLRRREHVHSPD